jgi:predicted nucleotidyltransferase
MCQVVTSQADIVGALRHALRTYPGVRLGLLFGSCARGQHRPDSDVDLAVLGSEVDRLALAAHVATALGREVQVQSLDEDPGVPLLEEIVRDGLVVAEAAPGIAASWRTRALLQLETDRPWYGRMRDAWLRRVAERGI